MLMNLLYKHKSSFTYLLLIFVTFVATISFLPLDVNDPNPDSGIFLYMGQQILKGGTLYRDLWDNKGPVLYYINALALFISPGSMWGLYLYEFLSLFIAVTLGYLVMNKAFGRIPAIVASIIWPLSLFYLNSFGGGNVTEEYSLPLSFAALYFYLRSRNSKSGLFYIFLVGVTFSLSFFLRPNNTGMQVTIALLIFFSGIITRSFYLLLKQILAYALGTIVIIAAVLLYFHWMNALGDFYDSFIRYNSVYSTTTLGDRISSLLFGLRLLSPSGLPLIAIAAWFIAVFTAINGTKLGESQRVLILVSVIGIPVEFLLSSISSLMFDHYYICWLPVFAILTSFFLYGLISNFSDSSIIFCKRQIRLSHIWVLGLLVAMSCLAIVKIPDRVGKFISTSRQSNVVVEGIRDNLKDEQYLLMWGAAAYFNLATGMKSPTRYFHQLPFYVCGYRTEEMIEEFLDDIKQKKPLIVDTSSTDISFAPIDNNERKKWEYRNLAGHRDESCKNSPKMEELFEYINSRYTPVYTFKKNKWKIYQFDDNKGKS